MTKVLRCIFTILAGLVLLAPGNSFPAEYHLCIPPYLRDSSYEETIARYKGLIGYMDSATGHEFILYGGQDYEDCMTLVAAGDVDLAMFGPKPYTAAIRNEPNLEIVAITARRGRDGESLKPTFTCHLLTLKSRKELNTIQDAQGLDFGIANRQSTSGLPMASYLLDGDDPEKFFKTVFVMGSHPKCTDALAAGSIDICGTYDFNWTQAVARHGDIFKELGVSPPMPLVAMIASVNLPDGVVQDLRGALPDIPPNLLEGLYFQGFALHEGEYVNPMSPLETVPADE